jgi:nucleoside-diphosphate-sugar epimerase
MRIAILGATSQIAKDLVLSFAASSNHELTLYARNPDTVKQWLAKVSLLNRYPAADFADFGSDQSIEAIINFVGVGNPAQAAAMGASICDVTFKYDELALSYVRQHPDCRYIFLSSGAAYGNSFDTPADSHTEAVIAINSFQAQNLYGIAKLHAECRHRALTSLPIVDIRVFNYFSRTQDVSARFLMTDIVRAIQGNVKLETSAEYMVRDFLHPTDFCSLVNCILASPPANDVVDCYSQAPIDKPTLLATMQEKYGLKFEISTATKVVNATGSKPYYFSLNRKAKDFGYAPSLSSLGGIVLEMNALLQ